MKKRRVWTQTNLLLEANVVQICCCSEARAVNLFSLCRQTQLLEFAEIGCAALGRVVGDKVDLLSLFNLLLKIENVRGKKMQQEGERERERERDE